MQEEQRKLQREANSLAQRLEAVLHDKFTPRSGFDADTPIDKTLQFLQGVIAVSLAVASACMHTQLKHLPNVEKRCHCPQAFLSLDFRCRMNVFKTK